MLRDAQLSPSAERWVKIDGFPRYSVSDWGRVMNDDRGVYLKPTRKPDGLLMVGLMNQIQYKRSLPLLVARAFVPQSRNTFDTPINLNGDRSNNHFTNLMWRPLWFARKYVRQFFDNHFTINAPIEDVEAGIVYENSMQASVINGLLDHEIYMSMIENTYVWPTGQVFREAR